jgi:hypothetical protein
MRLAYFLVAVLYGAAWPTAVLNTVVALGRLATGTSPDSALPFALLAWGVIGYVHRQRGWPPFAPRRAPG